MKSRLLGGVAAIILALLGAVLVYSYAANADTRAMQDLKPSEVLVVNKAVQEGTPVEDLADSVALEARPAGSVPTGALADMTTSAGLVTVTDLVPGEVLLSTRLVDPATLHAPGTVPVPKGLQEVTFSLEPQRLVGGNIVAGNTVGIFASFDKGALKNDPEASTTGRVFHKVLVTRLQRAEASANETTDDAQTLPAGTMLVTVAVGDKDAAKIIYSAEFGRIWLTGESADAKESAPGTTRTTEVYP